MCNVFSVRCLMKFGGLCPLIEPSMSQGLYHFIEAIYSMCYLIIVLTNKYGYSHVHYLCFKETNNGGRLTFLAR